MGEKWKAVLDAGIKIMGGLTLSLFTSCFVILAIIPTACDFPVLFLFYANLSRYLFLASALFFLSSCWWFVYSKILVKKSQVDNLVKDGFWSHNVGSLTVFFIVSLFLISSGIGYLLLSTNQIFSYGTSSPEQLKYEVVCKKRPDEKNAVGEKDEKKDCEVKQDRGLT